MNQMLNQPVGPNNQQNSALTIDKSLDGSVAAFEDALLPDNPIPTQPQGDLFGGQPGQEMNLIHQ